MQAVLLAGGVGSRLRPLTDTTPKPLLPIAHKSALSRTLCALAAHGCTDAVLTLCYHGEQIERAFGDTYEGIRLRYVYEAQPRGTAGSVRLALPHLKNEPLLVLAGDVVCDLDLRALYEYHNEKGAQATLALAHADDPLEYGVVVCDSEGKIERFLEKPSRAQAVADTVNAGIYCLNYEVLTAIPEGTVYDFSRDLFPSLLGHGLYGYPFSGAWCDVGQIEDFYRESFRLGAKEGTLSGSNLLGKNVSVHPTAHVARSILFDGVTVGAGAHVEEAIVCKNAVLAPHAHLCPLSVVGEGARVEEGAILQEGVRLGAGEVLERQTTRERHYSFPNTARAFLFDGGIHGSQGQINPAFALQLGRSAAACVAKSGVVGARIGVLHADTPYCALLCSAFRCGVLEGGVDLEFDGIGFPALASFAAHRRGTLTFCIFEEANGEIRISIYDENGLYPDRSTERALCAAFADTQQGGSTRIGVCEAIEGIAQAYQGELVATLGDLKGESVYLNHCASARMLAGACRQGGAVCNAAPDALRLILDADGRGVSLLESKPTPFSCDFWHVVAILIAHHVPDTDKPLPLPFAAPMHLRTLAKDCGYTLALYSECPHDKSEAAVRARAAELPLLRDAVFACAALLRLRYQTKKAVSELAQALPAFFCTARKISAPSVSPLKLLCALGTPDGDGVRIGYSALRYVRILPLGAQSLRLLCEAESMEAAQEIFIKTKQAIEEKAKEIEGHSPGKDTP